MTTHQDKAREIDYDKMVESGLVVWHTSQEGGGPDVGVSIGLGDGRMLWCGEISRARWEEAGEEAAALGNDFGWWLILYARDSSQVLGKLTNEHEAHELVNLIAAQFIAAHEAGRREEREACAWTAEVHHLSEPDYGYRPSRPVPRPHHDGKLMGHNMACKQIAATIRARSTSHGAVPPGPSPDKQ